MNLDDFNILASRFGTVVAPAGASAASFAQTRIGDADADDAIEDLLA